MPAGRAEGRLSPAEESLLSETGVAVVAVDQGGSIVFASQAALICLGWSAALIGRSLISLIPQRLQERHLAGFQRYLTTGTSHLQGHAVRVPALREDGREREIDLAIRVFKRPDGSLLAAAAVSRAVPGSAPPDLERLESALQRRTYKLI